MLTTTLLAVIVLAGVFCEASARVDYVAATSLVSDTQLVEDRKYEEAILLFAEVANRHPWSITALYDVQRHIADLTRQQARSGTVQAKPQSER
jgi:hypothetical protein